MICARGKSKQREFKLTARNAAGRFAVRRGAKNRTDRWLPLVLRWRQRRRARPNAKAERGMLPAPVFCFPQNRFHFATYLGGAGRRRSPIRDFPAATIYRERVTFDRGWTNTVTIDRVPQARRAYRLSSPKVFPSASINRERVVLDRSSTRVVTLSLISQPRGRNRPSLFFQVRERAGLQLGDERVEPLSLPRIFEPMAQPISRRRRGSLVREIPTINRANTRREELTHVFKTHLHTLEQRPLLLSLRPPAPETPAFAGPPQRKLSQIQFDPSEELVWRRTRSPVTITENIPNSIIRDTGQREPVRVSAEETPVQPVSAPIGRATPQQITKLDPAFVDRLTDDVIRRVEQRARIERQRRGL